MTWPLTITLLGEPVAFARMRISGTAGHFIPRPQRNTMAALRILAQDGMAGRNPIDEPVAVHMLAEFGIAASKSKRWQAAALAGEIRPGKRPDLSNILKLAEDALNGVVFRDDALIVEMRLRKIYSLQPKVIVTISPLALLGAVPRKPSPKLDMFDEAVACRESANA